MKPSAADAPASKVDSALTAATEDVDALDADQDTDVDTEPEAAADLDVDADAASPPVGGAAAAPASAAADSALDERDRQVLEFERKWWRHAGAKEQAIRDTFGLSATRYYQILNGLLDNPAALAFDPVLIGRLRRLRSTRARTRRR